MDRTPLAAAGIVITAALVQALACLDAKVQHSFTSVHQRIDAMNRELLERQLEDAQAEIRKLRGAQRSRP